MLTRIANDKMLSLLFFMSLTLLTDFLEALERSC